MKKIYIPFLLAIVLSACSSTIPVVTPTPTEIFPTVTPWPTLDSFDVLTKYPEGKFLFAEAYSAEECLEGCCIQYEAMPNPFLFKNGKLYIVGGFLKPPVENWGETRQANKAIGLYYFGTITDGHFTFIKSFPYQFSDSEFVINSVDSQGNISVKTSYGNILLPPGKNIERDWVEKGSESCQIRHFTGIVNYGFISDNQVVVVSHSDDFP